MKRHTTKIIVALICLGFLSTYVITYFKGAKRVPTKIINTDEIAFNKEGELAIIDTTGIVKKKLEIEIAETSYETQTGLMYRSKMQENRGMLFIFNNERMHSFYMKNTRIPLDILYINKDFEIVSVVENATPYDETSLPSQFPVMYVLEVNGGMKDKWGIELGDKISFTKN